MYACIVETEESSWSARDFSVIDVVIHIVKDWRRYQKGNGSATFVRTNEHQQQQKTTTIVILVRIGRNEKEDN